MKCVICEKPKAEYQCKDCKSYYCETCADLYEGTCECFYVPITIIKVKKKKRKNNSHFYFFPRIIKSHDRI